MRPVSQAGPGPEYMWTQMHFARAPAKADGQSATSSTAAKTAVDEKQKGR